MIACRKNDVSQATLRPARTSDKHWQRQYREFRDRRGKGGRGVMRNVLLQAESIRCACFVHLGVSMPEDKSGDVLEQHIRSISIYLLEFKGNDTFTAVQYPRQQYASLPSKNNEDHQACVRPSQESRKSLPSRWREPSSGAAMAGLPARPRVPSPSLPINQRRLVRLCRLCLSRLSRLGVAQPMLGGTWVLESLFVVGVASLS